MSTVANPRIDPDPLLVRHKARKGEPAWDIALLFPAQGEWTEEQYLALDARTNWPIELANGCLEILPMPTILHQRIVSFLYELLSAFVKAHRLGEVLFAPLPVRLWPSQLREPDVIFFRPERIRDPKKPPKGADLVMEIVSDEPEDRKRDLITKRREYARAGIPEYWIVDPKKKCISVLSLKKRAYKTHGEFHPDSQADSVLLPGFQVDVKAVFAAGEGKSSPNH